MLLVLFLAGCSSNSHFLERSVDVDGTTYRYRVFLPEHYSRLRSWPVILFLHGSGERGDDNTRQLSSGLGPLLQRDGSRIRCIVVFPQSRPGSEWFGPMERQALAALDQSMREFHGDPARVYVTGVSMGGSGAWFMARHSGRFAAVVPISGEIVAAPDDPYPQPLPADIRRILDSPDPYANLASMIGRTPVWAFHGRNDPVISVEESRKMVTALRASGGDVRYSELPDVGHDAWDIAYADPELFRWLFAQRLSEPPHRFGRHELRAEVPTSAKSRRQNSATDAGSGTAR